MAQPYPSPDDNAPGFAPPDRLAAPPRQSALSLIEQTVLPPSPVPQPLLLLATLREETQDLHKRLEARLDIVAQFATLDAYRTVLERFYAFYRPLEGILAAPKCAASWAALGLDFGDRRKAGLLKSDLHTLGLTAAELAALERYPTDLLPALGTAAQLVGCAYVLEGATLGGQVIGRLLEGAQGLRPGAPGARFFHGYGLRTGAMWQQFRCAVEAFASREDAACPGSSIRIAEQAVAAACRTFAAMDAWLVPESASGLGERQV